MAIGFAVLMTAVVPVGFLLANVLQQSSQARQHITALGVAERWLEILGNEGPPLNTTTNQPNVCAASTWTSCTAISEGSGNAINTVAGTTYTVSAVFTWDTTSQQAANPCSTGTVPVLDLHVSVSWGAGSRSASSVTDATTLAFPPSGVQSNGFLAVQVNGYPTNNPPSDVTGNTFASRVADQLVEAQEVVNGVATGSVIEVSPNASGCALLEITPASYTVTVTTGPGSPGSGYTCNNDEVQEPDGVYSAAYSAEVDQALITNVTVQCDEGAAINLAYPSTTAIQDGVSCPNTTNVGCLATGQSSTSGGSQTAQGAIASYAGTTRSWGVGSGLTNLVKVNGTACTGGATNMCVAVGYNASGNAEVASAPGSTPNTWTASQILNGANPIAEPITQVTCPTSTECFAITDPNQSTSGAVSGSTPAYILEGAVTSSSVTWTVASVGTGISAITQAQITTLTQLVCSGTASCFAIGTSTIGGTTGALVMATTTTGSGATWLNDTPALSSLLSSLLSLLGLLGDHLGTSTLTQIVCPAGQTECLIVGEAVELNLLGVSLGVAGWSLYVSNTSPSTWTVFNLPSGLPSSLNLLSQFSSLTCDPTGAKCIAVLSTFTGSTYILSTPGAANLLSWTLDSIPAGIEQVDQVSCTGSTPECFATAATGYTPSPPAGASPAPTHLLYLPASSSAWSEDTGVPSSITSAMTAGTGFFSNAGLEDDNGLYGQGSNTATTNNGLFCSGTYCFAYGATSTGAFILSLGSPSGTPVWTSDTLPIGADSTTLFVSGVSCQGSTSTCLATGGTDTSGELLDYTLGTTTWTSDSTSRSLVGLYQTGLPIEINNSGLQPATTLEYWAPASSSSTDDTQIGPLFPFSTYAVGASYCPGGDTYFNSIATPSIIPGDTGANAVSVTVPLGLISLQATNTSGLPISGATISMAIDTTSPFDTSCATKLTPLTGGANPSSWTLINSGTDGFSRVAVMYQTYIVTVTVGATHATHTIEVLPSSVIDDTNSGSPITYPLPGVVKVAD